jgi:hypothetical protein
LTTRVTRTLESWLFKPYPDAILRIIFRVYGHDGSKVVARDRHSLGHVSEVLIPYIIILEDTPETIVVVLLAIVEVTGPDVM